jgi:gliding motility-associated-like protein
MKFLYHVYLLAFLFFGINVSFSQSVGGTTSGTASYCPGTNSGFVSLTGHTGDVIAWQFSTNSGGNWSTVSNPTTTQSYNNLTQTTWYRAIVKDGSSLADTSSIAIITIHAYAVAGTLSGGGTFCATSGNGTISITGNTGTVQAWEQSINNGTTWTTVSTSGLSYNYSAITQNTWYRAVVSNVAACASDTSNAVSFNISPQTVGGTLSLSDTVCNGSNGDTLKLSGYTGAILNWQSSTNNGTTWNTISLTDSTLPYSNISSTTWYRVTIKSGVCASLNSTIAKLVVVNPNQALAGADQAIIQYKNCQLNGSGTGTVTWSPTDGLSDPTILSPTASPLATTVYTLTVIDPNGCVTKDSARVEVTVLIPSAFTPNDDGVNDYFIIDKIKDYPQNSLSITDRWGVEVYSAAPYTNNWNGLNKNGKPLADDIYYYVFDYGVASKEIASGFILIKR